MYMMLEGVYICPITYVLHKIGKTVINKENYVHPKIV